MLSVSLCNSVQFRHLYRKLLHRNRRNSMRKSRIKSPCVWLKYLIWIWFLWKKDQIYTRHCSKQTLTTLKNLNYWQLLSLPLTYWGFKQSVTIWFLLFRKRLRKKKKKKKKKRNQFHKDCHDYIFGKNSQLSHGKYHSLSSTIK